MTKQQIKRAIEEVAMRKEKIFFLSLASGSARAVIEVLAELDENIRNRVFVRFVDVSHEALDYSKRLAKSFGLNGQLEWRRFSIFNTDKFCNDFKPDIVEMVGILDYLNDDQAEALINMIRRDLASGGRLITCNIVPNIEEPFITKGLSWPMIYRTPDQLQKLVSLAGFTESKVVIEPLGIHALCIATKDFDAPE